MRVAELGANMAWQLEQVIGSDVSVALRGCTARLRGRVPSEVARQAVLDITAELAPWLNAIDELELAPLVATGHEGTRLSNQAVSSVFVADFLENHAAATDAFAWSEDDEPVLPAMDPVIGLDHRGRVQVVGGFALSSLDEVDVEPSAHDVSLGDEALADAIRRELREDASTTALDLTVEVHDGVVMLLGNVPGPEDAEAAETVAAHVPGVQDVVDMLDVSAFNTRA